MKNSVKALAVSGTLLLAAAGAMAQGSPAPATAPLPKIAYLDVRTALLSTAEGRQMAAEIQSQFAPKQADMDNLRKQIEDIQNGLTTGARTLSDEERARRERQIQRLQQQGQRKQEEYKQELDEVQQDAIEKLSRKMGEVISRHARENGLLMVMDAQVCNIYCSTQLDITQDIIRLYDQAYPVKGAAAAPGTAKPAAARPAAQPPASPAPAKPTKP
ncbi:MAG TPA: OmpH family outer membrane protein [Candidatus Acidoferrales bacterium]|nr:OmpH family outer membrane protein [Candidatus Acidoferrales bacterium]